MSKQTGLGSNCYVGGYDLSGDIGALDKVSGSLGLLDVTPLNKSAHVRLTGQRDGVIEFTSYFDTAAGAEHPALKGLPTADVIASAFINPLAIGSTAACINAKQVNYDPTRAADGALTVKVSMQANAYGLEWCEALTAGLRTDTSATPGATQDDAAGTAFGGQGYLQVTAFTGTSVDIKIEHSTDNSTWSTLIDFGAQSAIGASRVTVSNSTTVNRYVRATTGTGTFTSITFAVAFNRNPIAGVVF